jgi:hypothetical protein
MPVPIAVGPATPVPIAVGPATPVRICINNDHCDRLTQRRERIFSGKAA